MNIIKNALIIIMLASPVISETKPDITLWGYQGWHPVNDYNDMNVVDDYNNINPYHAAMVYLPDFVTVLTINTQYLRKEALIEIDGAGVGTINMSGAGRLKISSGTVQTVNAKDYSKVYFHGGDVNEVSITQGATLVIFGYDFSLSDGVLCGRWTDGTVFEIAFLSNSDNVTLVYSKGGVTGDFNADRLVNFKDFALFPVRENRQADELVIVFRNWLKQW